MAVTPITSSGFSLFPAATTAAAGKTAAAASVQKPDGLPGECKT